MKISLPINYLLVILLLTSTLFHHVSTTNLALTFDANNNTCTASCNICCICSGGGWTRITYLDMSDSQRSILLGLDCTSQEVLELVEDRDLKISVVSQLNFLLVELAIPRCVV